MLPLSTCFQVYSNVSPLDGNMAPYADAGLLYFARGAHMEPSKFRSYTAPSGTEYCVAPVLLGSGS